MRSYALVDFDGFVFDIAALYVGVSRSVARRKLPEPVYDCRPFEAALTETLHNTLDDTAGAVIPNLVATIAASVCAEANLCRPHLGINAQAATAVLKAFQDTLQSYGIFAQDKGDIIQRSLKNGVYAIGQSASLSNLASEDFFTSGTCPVTAKIRSAHELESVSERLATLLSTAPWVARKVGTQQDLPDTLELVDWSRCLPCLTSMSPPPAPFAYPFKVLPLFEHGPPVCPERAFWNAHKLFTTLTVFEGTVVQGYGRGGAQLGIPTANLDSHVPVSGPSLPFPGVYFGLATLYESQWHQKATMCYDAILSVGYNPYYDNASLTVEPYLFHEFPERFDGAKIRLVIVGVLRPEANFPSFGQLVQAIQNDCEAATHILDDLRATDLKRFQTFYDALQLEEPLRRDGSIHDRPSSPEQKACAPSTLSS